MQGAYPNNMTQNAIITEKKGIYRLTQPPAAMQIPLIFDSPHSGRCYPADFQTRINHDDLICGEDRFVDQLFQTASLHGASLLCAEFPRCYIDANRHYHDISPSFVQGGWQGPFALAPSNKSTAGIGLIRELFINGRNLYDMPLSSQVILGRIEHYYTPYHKALQAEIERLHAHFGFVVHIDCHSMPHDAAPFTRQPAQHSPTIQHRAHIIIGDRDGATCGAQWRIKVGSLFEDKGFSVVYNQTFKGAEIVRKYGHPHKQQHSIQLEINRGLYLDTKGRHKSNGFVELAHNIDAIIQTLAADILSMV